MKSALFLAPALLALSLGAHAAGATGTTAFKSLAAAARPQDTITVRLPNQAVMTLLVRDAAQLRQLKNYHLDSLTSRLGTYIKQAEAAAKTSKTERVTMEFYPDKDQPGQNLPEQVRITTYRNHPNSNRIMVVLGRKLNVEVETTDNGDKKLTTRRTNGQPRRDSVHEAHAYRSHHTDFRFDVGLNAFVNQKAAPAGYPATADASPALRTWGARYVNLGLNYYERLGGKHSPVGLSFGPEFAFNSYMLEANNKWVDQGGFTQVVKETDGRQFRKTKLAVTTLNLPVMLNLRLRDQNDNHSTFRLGVGGFVGYRLGSHTKVTYTQEGKDFDDHQDGRYNLENFQYGLQGTIGYRALTLFAKYNMNDLFQAGKGPQTQVLSFGVRLFGVD